MEQTTNNGMDERKQEQKSDKDNWKLISYNNYENSNNHSENIRFNS